MDPVLEPKLVNRLTDLLTILSKKDALTIFLLAKDGLKAEADAPEKIGLTRKQYYTRLKQLVDNGLIDKYDDAYVHTTLGTFVHQKHLLELIEQVKNAEQMKMVDTLKRTRQFSEDDITSFVGKVTGMNLGTSTIPQARLTWSYEDMMSTVMEYMHLAKSEIFLATRFANDLVINNIAKKVNAGLHVKIIVDWNIMESYFESAGTKVAVSDKNSTERLNVTSNPYYPQPGNIARKFMDIPYCVIILDRKQAGIEIIDRNAPHKFNGAIFMKDETFATEITKIFNNWWDVAEEGDQTQLRNKFLERSH